MVRSGSVVARRSGEHRWGRGYQIIGLLEVVLHSVRYGQERTLEGH